MRRLVSVAATLSLAGCVAGMPNPPVPTGMQPVTAAEVEGWITPFRPRQHATIRFHWHFTQEGGSGGPGSVLVAAPDSLKLDVLCSLGLCRYTAAVVGDSALWAQPQDQVDKFVASYPLLWAMVGVPRPPGTGWAINGRQEGNRTAWQYVRGTDTVQYVLERTTGTILKAYVRQGSRPVGTVVTLFDAENHLVRSRLEVQKPQSRLDIRFDKAPRQITFTREAWLAPHDK